MGLFSKFWLEAGSAGDFEYAIPNAELVSAQTKRQQLN
jgi:hypothetical protein